MRLLLTALFTLLLAGPAAAARITVAVASNFAPAMEQLAAQFEAATGHEVVLSFGSTGKHYAQIRHGAPFDAFFAADTARPQRLEAEGAIVPGSRYSYARGALALWSPQPGLVDGPGVLRSGDFARLAIANPRIAPYGLAAKQTLQALALWQPLQGKLVRGENIGQTYQFVASGAAPLGFVAWSQLRQRPGEIPGSYWRVPPALHQPIDQQAVLLTDKPAARALLDYVRGPQGRALITDYGYELPE